MYFKQRRKIQDVKHTELMYRIHIKFSTSLTITMSKHPISFIENKNKQNKRHTY